MNSLPVKIMAVFVLLLAGENALEAVVVSSIWFNLLKFMLVAAGVLFLAKGASRAATAAASPPDQSAPDTAIVPRAMLIFTVLLAGEQALEGCGLCPAGYRLARFALIAITGLWLLQAVQGRGQTSRKDASRAPAVSDFDDSEFPEKKGGASS